jgi:general stress protein CsbA
MNVASKLLLIGLVVAIIAGFITLMYFTPTKRQEKKYGVKGNSWLTFICVLVVLILVIVGGSK